MNFSKGLVASLPARELREAVLPGSLFEPRAVLGQPISGTLRAAIRAVAAQCEAVGQRLVLIARPEIFTHGETRAWLMNALGGIEDHLSISDGSTIHLIPELRNHLFFYNPGQTRNVKALARLVERAPEIPQRIGVQVNSTISFRVGQVCYTPRPMLLQAPGFAFGGETEFRKFYLNPNSVQDSITRSEAGPPIGADFFDAFADIEYIAFTDSAANDPLFCRLVVKRILASVQQPQKLLILGAPLAQAPEDNFSRMMSVLMLGLCGCGAILPRAVLHNVVIASTLVDEALFRVPNRRSSLLVHETFEFWRCPVAYYRLFERVSVAISEKRRYDEHSLVELLEEACGNSPYIHWLRRMRRAAIESRAAED